MSNTVIKVENLSKQYRIGSAQAGYKTFRETLSNAVKAPLRQIERLSNRQSSIVNRQSETIWALKDVSFEVKRGEVVGIIGRNGAGKSTLLKILSKITEPTKGRVEFRGRVGSLLEVGTGFHPELTGHENVYMYGAILGMDRWEVTRKFDEIVAFAELDKFIETPVKRYSSGMYMRLAFAVAAHMETEILLIDEVLAVGDAAFQKKCLGKMNEVSKEGRTVLFVSHNMGAVQSLCTQAFQLDMGLIKNFGNVRSVISNYLSTISNIDCRTSWAEQTAPGNEELKLMSITAKSASGNSDGIYPSDSNIHIDLEFISNTIHSALCVGFDLLNSEGEIIARTYQTDQAPDNWPKIKIGKNIWRCIIPAGLLNAGNYYVSPKIGIHNMYWIVNLETSIQFEIVLNHGVSPFWNILGTGNRPGMIAPIFPWIDCNIKK